MLEPQELQKEIQAIAFEADAVTDLEYRVQTFTVSTNVDDEPGMAELGVKDELEELADELDDAIGYLESARDELRAIASRLETEAEEAVEAADEEGGDE